MADENTPEAKSKKNWLLKHKAISIIGAVIIVIVGIIALGGGEASFNFSVGNKSAACRYEDKDLCKFLNTISETDSVSMELSGSADGTTAKSTIKIQGDDKTQIITSTNGIELNIITIGKTIYAKQADGTWNKYIDEKNELDTGSNADWKGDFEKSLNDETNKTTYERVGEEKCDDLDCLKYKVTNSDDPSINSFIFFDDKKFLMRKATSDVNGSITEVIYSYDNVNISEPENAKTVDSAAELYGGIEGI